MCTLILEIQAFTPALNIEDRLNSVNEAGGPGSLPELRSARPDGDSMLTIPPAWRMHPWMPRAQFALWAQEALAELGTVAHQHIQLRVHSVQNPDPGAARMPPSSSQLQVVVNTGVA